MKKTILATIYTSSILFTNHAFAHGNAGGLSRSTSAQMQTLAEVEAEEMYRARLEQMDYADRIKAKIDLGLPFNIGSGGCPPISAIARRPIAKLVALTFDDGPSNSTTPKVLSVLREFDIQATFFVQGDQAISKMKLLDQMREEGHVIANHSLNHKNFLEINTDEQIRQMKRTDEIIHQHAIPVKLFRYPYGNATCFSNDYVKTLNYSGIVGWHVDSCDWGYEAGVKDKDGKVVTGTVADKYAKICGVKAENKSNYVNHVVSETIRKNGGIILMHDPKTTTANNLRKIIARLVAEGFSFTNLDDPMMRQFFK